MTKDIEYLKANIGIVCDALAARADYWYEEAVKCKAYRAQHDMAYRNLARCEGAYDAARRVRDGHE